MRLFCHAKLARAVLAAVVCLCVAAGCAPRSGEEEIAPAPEAPGQSLQVRVVAAASQPAGSARAAEVFAQKLRELSGGALNAEVVLVPDTGAGFAEAEFALLDSTTDSGFCRFFATLSRPFLYNSYLHFTSSTNSEQVLRFLEEEMRREKNALPLASFYGGSPHLLTQWGAANMNFLEDTVLGVAPQSPAARYWEDLGATLLPAENQAKRLDDMLSLHTEGMELYPAPAEDLDLQGGAACLTMTFHGASPLWLVADATFYDSLSDFEKAVVEEAKAYLFDILDGEALEQERLMQEKLLDQQAEVLTDFSFSRGIISQRVASTQDLQERHLLNMVLGMAEYAH